MRIIMCAICAFCGAAVAVEPTWPGNFDEMLTASKEAVRPASSQIGISSIASILSMKERDERVSEGFGTALNPFDSVWSSQWMSNFSNLDTRKPSGMYIILR